MRRRLWKCIIDPRKLAMGVAKFSDCLYDIVEDPEERHELSAEQPLNLATPIASFRGSVTHFHNLLRIT